MKKCICLTLATTLLLAGCATGKPSSTTPSSTTASLTPSTSYTMTFDEYSQQLREEWKAKANDKPIDELAMTEYAPEDIFPGLDMFASSNFTTVLYHFLEEFPTECVRVPDNASAYTVHKLKDGWRLYSFFPACFFLDYAFVVKDLLKWEDFNTISAGSTLAEVESVDAGTKLFHTYAGNEAIDYIQYGKKTFHLVEEGIVCIEYDGEWDSETGDPLLSSYIVKKITLYPTGEPIPGELFSADPYRGPSADKINFKILEQDMP